MTIVIKRGDCYSAFVSYDGTIWMQLGTTQYLPGLVNNTSFYIGIAVSSNSDHLAEVVLDNFSYVNLPTKAVCVTSSNCTMVQEY
jgi:hypothetical protein